jgi:hypothetical protein
MPSYEEKMERDALQKEAEENDSKRKKPGAKLKSAFSQIFMPCPHCRYGLIPFSSIR